MATASESAPRTERIIIQHRAPAGTLAGILGCIFGVMGIFFISIIFVPLAALCAITALVRGINSGNTSAIGLSVIAGFLCFFGFITSPTLLLLFGASLLAGLTGTVEFRNGKRIFKRDRRFRRMPIYSDGRREVITVHNSKTARLIGKYMSAVRQFFETEDIELLAPFLGQSVPDISGKRYGFETRPNVLLRLDASGVEPFELVYAIVKPE